MQISRTRAAELGQETLRILEAGRYLAGSGKRVEIGPLLRRAQEGTCSYPPDQDVADATPGDRATRITVVNETTLTALQKLVAAGVCPVALNFASAKNPGGGFLSGARAQEESLARASGLYSCLAGNPMYAFHRGRDDSMYTDYVIYSPDVPIFRDDDGTLLDEPFLSAFITSPAVNAKVVLASGSANLSAIQNAMWTRILKVLAVAALHQHQALVLGAWGCGAFGNDSRVMAGLFRRALTENYRGVFTDVVFAITDWSAEQRFIGPFRDAFRTFAHEA